MLLHYNYLAIYIVTDAQHATPPTLVPGYILLYLSSFFVNFIRTMRFSTISTVLAIVGSASVLAVPVLDTVGDAGGLGSLGGTGDLSVILEELAAGGLSGSGGDLGGLGGLKRTTPQPEYVGSPQVDTSNSCNGETKNQTPKS